MWSAFFWFLDCHPSKCNLKIDWVNGNGHWFNMLLSIFFYCIVLLITFWLMEHEAWYAIIGKYVKNHGHIRYILIHIHIQVPKKRLEALATFFCFGILFIPAHLLIFYICTVFFFCNCCATVSLRINRICWFKVPNLPPDLFHARHMHTMINNSTNE